MHLFCEKCLGKINAKDVELFRVGPRTLDLSLESVDYFGTSEQLVVEKKKNLL